MSATLPGVRGRVIVAGAGGAEKRAPEAKKSKRHLRETGLEAIQRYHAPFSKWMTGCSKERLQVSCCTVRAGLAGKLEGKKVKVEIAAKEKLRLPAESDVIVKIEVIVPRFHVFARLTDVADAFRKELERFDVAIRAALIVISAPLLDFPWRMLVWRVLLNPRQHLAVAFAGGEFGS